jgi:hypothetical protein
LVINERNSSILIEFKRCRHNYFAKWKNTKKWFPETYKDCDKEIESLSEEDLMNSEYQLKVKNSFEIITLEDYFARASKQLDAYRLLYKRQIRENHSVTCFVAIQIGRKIVVKELLAGV